MSEFDTILMQNANLTLGIITLISSLNDNIVKLQSNYQYKNKYLDIKLYREIKEYLEKVLEVSYGKRK